MSLSGVASPWWLLLLFAVAALVVGYVVMQRMRTLRVPHLSLLNKVVRCRPGHWRRASAALLGVALIVLTVALAGPTSEQQVPRNRAIVMLVIDTSQSMQATDVQPTRLQAAQVAAKLFAQKLTPGINLGLISFAGSAVTLVSPTTDRGPVLSSIDGLKLADATATGEAIFSALQTIKNFGQVVSGPDGPPPARIVLMSDGKQTVPGFDPDSPRGEFTAAREAKKENAPVSTISFGTSTGTVMLGGQETPVPVDDYSLYKIAKLAGGNFFKAASADELKKIYDTIGEQLGYEKRLTTASKSWFVLGTVLAILGVADFIPFNQRGP